MRTLKTKLQVTILIAVLVMLIALGGGVPTASAQNSTVLTFDPDLVSVPLGNQVQLQLWVLEGVNVNAFDIIIEYDPVRVQLVSWGHGDILHNLFEVVPVINEPGLLHCVFAQLATEGFTGSGVLLNLYFLGVGLGESGVHLADVTLSNSEGNSIALELQDGIISVVNAPTFTPTQTLTSTPAWTATSLPSNTPTATATSLLTATPTASPSVTQTATQITTQTAIYTLTPTATSTTTQIGSPTATMTAIYNLTPTATLAATQIESQTATPTATWPVQPSQTPAWPESGTGEELPTQPGSEGLGKGQTPWPGEGSQGGEAPPAGGSEGNIGSGTGVSLALVPGYEQTAQVAHYATLMSQAEALQAGTLPVENSQGSLETTLWILLIVGLVILAVLLVTAIRRRRENN